MSFNPKTVVILGAGIMGAQIAAAFASAGCNVSLLDLLGESSPNERSEKGLAQCRKASWPSFYRTGDLARVRCGNYRDDLAAISQADLVIEVVLERLDVKASVLEMIAPFLGPQTKVATNTSGILMASLEEVMPDSMKPHFIGGIHFFNPTRLPLLELIFTDHVSGEERTEIADFFRDRLGKEVVRAKDRPGFAGNRVGAYAMMLVMQALARGEFSIPELEELTGPLVGRPKSGTFRTADVVGLPTMLKLTKYLYANLTDDRERDVFKPPAFLDALVAQNGAFSFKDRQKGVILSFDPSSGGYLPLTADNLGELPSVKSTPHPADRIAALMERTDRVGGFVTDFYLRFLNYCAWRVGEVADTPGDIDRALRAGFAWEVGPFELWNRLGFNKIAGLMRAHGLSLPQWVSTSTSVAIPIRRSGSNLMPPNPLGPDSATRYLGNGVLQFLLTGTGRTLSSDVIDGLHRALDQAMSDKYVGLVIGDGEGDTFCAGANLKQIGGAIRAGDFNGINGVLDRLQTVFDRLYSFEKPVVAALSGKALGGGAELLMAAPMVIAAPDSYVGLVEMGVGVIPAGCGTTHFAQRAAQQAGATTVADAGKVTPFLRDAFLRIAMGQVTKSAHQALDAGFFSPSSRIEMRPGNVLEASKAAVLEFAEGNYIPRAPRAPFLVPGANGRAVLEVGIEGFLAGGQITKYDAYLASRLAWAITGGDLSDAAVVSPQYLYALERQVFVELVKNPGTHQKMARFAKG